MPDPHKEALEVSLRSIEDHVADIAGSLEKLRATQHTLVGKAMILEDLQRHLELLPVIARNQAEMMKTLGRVSDRLDEIDELRGRVVRLEADGKRV